MSDKKIGSIAMLITVIIWGVSFVNIKVAVAVLPPMTLGFLRFLLASFLLFIFVKVKKQNLFINRKDYYLLVIAGAIGITAYFYFENNGVKITTASIASLVIASIPVLSTIAESVIYKTKITFKKWMCLVLSIIGVLLIVGFDFKELVSSGFARGYIMMFMAAITAVIYAVVTKPLFKKYNQLSIVFYQSLIGTIFFIPFAAIEKTNWSLVDSKIILNVLALGVFASAMAFYLNLVGLKHLGISRSAVYLNIIPIVSVVVSMIFLGETITLMQLIGGILVIISVYLINKVDVKHLGV
ncbi:DMT family transporter [Helicovermis profundi]|uniref:DMT family transporter n=1 Tax=Helicovermis profundi TaxID=3065157 RepID=A0AAU9E134_9FIRM|nr:DMT family transporter [Clostridia bacterium S502]